MCCMFICVVSNIFDTSTSIVLTDSGNRYDDAKRYAFVAEYNGDISVVLLEENNLHKLTQLRGHSGDLNTVKSFV